MIAITGNTFPVKEQLKALGGRWDATAKAWNVPEERADEARALVAGAGPQAPRRAPQAAPRRGYARAVRAAAPAVKPACAGTHSKGDGSWWLKDARGIECGRVCDRCERWKMSGYRAEIFSDSLYQAEEAIEASDY